MTPDKNAADPDPDDYGGDKIQVLEGLEAVRRRPGMYIGDTTTRGLHHLVYEIVDNSVDESLAGFCKNIHVRITPDDGIVVTDDGRGIPTDEVPGQGLPGVTVAMTKLHAGGKFDHGAYKVSGGLHGVGASVVNALSERCEVEVYQRGKIHYQAFERGKALGKLEVRGKTDKRGTKTYFKPDGKIFPVTTFDMGTISSRLRELAFLNKGLSIKITDERSEPVKEETFRYEGGLKEFVSWLNDGKDALHADVFYVDKELDQVQVEVAFQFNTGYTQVEQSFANNIHTGEGGTHLSGFRIALTRRLSEYAKRAKFFGPDEKPTGDHFREGLTAVISVKVREPQFEGQTKTKLGNGEVEGIVQTAFGDALVSWLEESPRAAKAICEKSVLAYRAYEAARKAKDLVRRKGALASGNLPGKLADCQNRDLETTELFIVEGESAGGTAKGGRDRATQAILPLRGKILNVEKARLDKMLGHEEIRTLITAIGTGIGRTDQGDEGFDLSKLRYGKIIIMTDADVDGSHIRTLLLTFLFRHMLPLIEAGRVYVAQPPLFKVSRKKVHEYVFEEKALKAKLLALGTEGTRLETVSGKGETIQGAAFGRLVDALGKLEDLARSIERRGTTDGGLPRGGEGRAPAARDLAARQAGRPASRRAGLRDRLRAHRGGPASPARRPQGEARARPEGLRGGGRPEEPRGRRRDRREALRARRDREGREGRREVRRRPQGVDGPRGRQGQGGPGPVAARVGGRRARRRDRAARPPERGAQGRTAWRRRAALQGTGRDERRPAQGDDHGPGAAHAAPDPPLRRRGVRPALRPPHGRERRTPQALHRAARAGRHEHRHLSASSPRDDDPAGAPPRWGGFKARGSGGR